MLVTRQASTRILNGITRLSILRLAAEAGVEFEERPFSVEEAYECKGGFSFQRDNLRNASHEDRWKTYRRWSSRGPLAKRLRQAYWGYAAGDHADLQPAHAT